MTVYIFRTVEENSNFIHGCKVPLANPQALPRATASSVICLEAMNIHYNSSMRYIYKEETFSISFILPYGILTPVS